MDKNYIFFFRNNKMFSLAPAFICGRGFRSCLRLEKQLRSATQLQLSFRPVLN